MESQIFPPNVAAAAEIYASWVAQYGPFEWIQSNDEGDVEYERAKSADNSLVWTEYHTSEHIEAIAGFSGPSGHWELHGWHVASKPRLLDGPEAQQAIIVEFHGECWCFDEESEAGTPGCGGCDGEGFRYYDFEN